MSEDLKSCPFCGDVAMLELIARIRELEGAVTKSADDHEALLREWMYTPFPKEAQVMGSMSPPSGPFAKAVESILFARTALRTTGGEEVK